MTENYKSLEPRTPKEYLEAIRRLTIWAEEHLDQLVEGDGVTLSDEEDDQTLTDLFHVISGAALCALDDIAKWHKLNNDINNK
jgi:NADH:ubiquinone oxidoreductase subunit F (NADH-binding)